MEFQGIKKKLKLSDFIRYQKSRDIFRFGFFYGKFVENVVILTNSLLHNLRIKEIYLVYGMSNLFRYF